MRLQVAPAFIDIETRRGYAFVQLDGLEGSPWGVLRRKIRSCRIRRDREDATRSFEDMYFQLSSLQLARRHGLARRVWKRDTEGRQIGGRFYPSFS
jgi:hypothetical protein